MSSKRGRLRNKSSTATSPDITYSDPVNCQWDTCMKQFSCITDLVQHIEKTHTLKGIMKDYVCLWENCWRKKKPFKDRYKIIIHLRSHTGEKPYRCPVSPPTDTSYTNPANCEWDTCMQQFSRITDLTQHIEKTHMLKEIIKNNVCLWRNCSRNRTPFKYRHMLVYHLQSHSGEKHNKCPYQGCNKILSSLECLKVHIRRHTGEKRYKCQIQGCNRSFVTSTECSYHQKTHFKKRKPFACTFPGCNKSYTDPLTLRKHNIEKHQQRKKPSIETSDKLEPSIEASDELEPSIETTDKIGNCNIIVMATCTSCSE